MAPSRFALAKERLQADVVNVVGELFGANAKPRLRKRGLWNVINPWRSGAKASQMVVWLTGARTGGWKDFVTGETGDMIDLVAYCREGIVHADSRMRAVEWAEDRYGIRAMAPAARAKAAEEAKARRARIEADDRRRRETARDRARRMFFSAEAEIRGTAAEAYFESRGIALNAVPHMEHSFRFFPAAEYWVAAARGADGRKLGKGPAYPALVSAMSSADGTICACHLTFLAADGRGKAPVKDLDPSFSAKLMWPDTAGLVIRVARGPSGLKMEDEAQAGGASWLGVTEGIEDAASVAIAAADLRVHAAGSLSGLLHLPDHAAVRGFLIFKDNDWGKPQATALFNRAIARLKTFGKPVEAIAMPADWGKDVNDALNA